MQVEQNAVKPMFKKNTYHINHLCHWEMVDVAKNPGFFFWHPLLTTNEVHAFLTLTVAKLNKKKILIELSHKLKRDSSTSILWSVFSQNTTGLHVTSARRVAGHNLGYFLFLATIMIFLLELSFTILLQTTHFDRKGYNVFGWVEALPTHLTAYRLWNSPNTCTYGDGKGKLQNRKC